MNELIVDAIKDELESLGWEYEVEDEYGSYSISSWVNHRVGRILILINVEDDKTSLNTIHMHASDVYSNPMAFKILNDENWTTDLKLAIRHDNAKQTYDLWCSSAPVLNDSIWAEDVIREMIFGSVCAIERCYDHIKQHNGNKSVTQEPSVIGKLATHECKPDVGIVDDRLMKNLYAATRTGNIERVRQLLEKPGIDINKPIEGMTFLYVASLYGYSEIVSLLLEIPGIDVNKSYRGLTPLYVASMDGFSEVVRILLATPGIDIDKGNPINAARKKGHMEVVKLLQEAMTDRLTAPASNPATHEESPIENPVDDSLMRELVLAVAAGNTEEVRDLLLQPGIDINGAVDGYTPLSAASLQGHTDVVRLLLSVSGLDVNNADHKDGETPLLSSAGHGYTEIVKLLLAAPGINVNKANNDGNTPLHAAAGQGHAEIVKLLLTVPGIDVNTEEAEHSPLALASFMGHTEVVRLLLSCPGIDVNRGNPLLVAKHEGHTAIVRLLLAAGA